MKYFIGIDGGGTKTDYLLCDETGREVFRCKTGPCRFNDVTHLLDEDIFAAGLETLYAGAGINTSDIKSVGFGMPCYGEFPREDPLVTAQVFNHFKEIPCTVVNDVETGWAGALALSPGINVVSGTGSISFGKDASGKAARCGGWWSNEGSGHWIGYKAVELFLKQLDGRMAKTALYDIMRKEFSLKNDSDIFEYTTKNLKNNRKNTAAVQLLLDRAAESGDPVALKVYEEAGYELAFLVKGCYRQLNFTGRVNVSYTGSIFRAGKKLLDPFCAELGNEQFDIIKPLLDPGQGAVLLGISAGCPEEYLNRVKAGMLACIQTDRN